LLSVSVSLSLLLLLGLMVNQSNCMSDRFSDQLKYLASNFTPRGPTFWADWSRFFLHELHCTIQIKCGVFAATKFLTVAQISLNSSPSHTGCAHVCVIMWLILLVEFVKFRMHDARGKWDVPLC
jgi:hypothetical protein